MRLSFNKNYFFIFIFLALLFIIIYNVFSVFRIYEGLDVSTLEKNIQQQSGVVNELKKNLDEKKTEEEKVSGSIELKKNILIEAESKVNDSSKLVRNAESALNNANASASANVDLTKFKQLTDEKKSADSAFSLAEKQKKVTSDNLKRYADNDVIENKLKTLEKDKAKKKSIHDIAAAKTVQLDKLKTDAQKIYDANRKTGTQDEINKTKTDLDKATATYISNAANLSKYKMEYDKSSKTYDNFIKQYKPYFDAKKGADTASVKYNNALKRKTAASEELTKFSNIASNNEFDIAKKNLDEKIVDAQSKKKYLDSARAGYENAINQVNVAKAGTISAKTAFDKASQDLKTSVDELTKEKNRPITTTPLPTTTTPAPITTTPTPYVSITTPAPFTTTPTPYVSITTPTPTKPVFVSTTPAGIPKDTQNKLNEISKKINELKTDRSSLHPRLLTDINKMNSDLLKKFTDDENNFRKVTKGFPPMNVENQKMDLLMRNTHDFIKAIGNSANFILNYGRGVKDIEKALKNQQSEYIKIMGNYSSMVTTPPKSDIKVSRDTLIKTANDFLNGARKEFQTFAKKEAAQLNTLLNFDIQEFRSGENMAQEMLQQAINKRFPNNIIDKIRADIDRKMNENRKQLDSNINSRRRDLDTRHNEMSRDLDKMLDEFQKTIQKIDGDLASLQ